MRSISIYALLIGATAQGAVTQQPLTGHVYGACQPYDNSTTNHCGPFGMPGSVFVYDGTTMELMEEQVGVAFGVIMLASSVAKGDCMNQYLQLLCLMSFPPCYSESSVDVPQRICKPHCEYVIDDECSETFSAVRSLGFASNVMSCVDEIGDQAKTGTFSYVNYLNQWSGTPLSLAAATEDIALPDSSIETVPCFTPGADGIVSQRTPCASPYMEVTYTRDPTNETAIAFCRDYSNDLNTKICISQCSLPCKYPIWADSAYIWDIQWLCKVIPGLIAIPLNILVLVSESSKHIRAKKQKKKSPANGYIVLCALFGLLYTLFDALPSAIMKFDLRCDGADNMIEASENGAAVCDVFAYSIHLLQAMMAAVGVTLYQLYRKLSAASDMKSYKPSELDLICSVLYIGVFPLVAFIGAAGFALTEEERSGMFSTNATETQTATYNKFRNQYKDAYYIRSAFTCMPAFNSDLYDWLFITGPLLMTGAISIFFSFKLLQVVRKMAGGSLGLTGSSKGKGSSKTTMALARTMLMFSFACFILNVINISTMIPYMVQAEIFARNIRRWVECSATGVNLAQCQRDFNGDISKCKNDMDITNKTQVEGFCGVFDESAPSWALLAGMNFAKSVAPMVFGLLFGRTALFTLMKTCKAGIIHPGTSGAGASSAASQS